MLTALSVTSITSASTTLPHTVIKSNVFQESLKKFCLFGSECGVGVIVMGQETRLDLKLASE